MGGVSGESRGVRENAGLRLPSGSKVLPGVSCKSDTGRKNKVCRHAEDSGEERRKRWEERRERGGRRREEEVGGEGKSGREKRLRTK